MKGYFWELERPYYALEVEDYELVKKFRRWNGISEFGVGGRPNGSTFWQFKMHKNTFQKICKILKIYPKKVG